MCEYDVFIVITGSDTGSEIKYLGRFWYNPHDVDRRFDELNRACRGYRFYYVPIIEG